MAQITKLEAAKNADKAEKDLNDLRSKKQAELDKIEDKYREQISNAERISKLADGVLLKLVQPKAPAKRGTGIRKAFAASTSSTKE